MTPGERLLKTLRHQPVDRLPDWEFGAWQQTVDRWHGEGLPAEYDGVWSTISRYFGTDDDARLNLDLKIGLLPGFEGKVLEEKGDHLIFQDGDGAVCEMLRPELGASIPRYLRFAVETRRDWEKLRDERLDPGNPERLPADLDEIRRLASIGDLPVRANAGSLYGWIRNWMGVENLSYAVYDDPGWVEEMMEHLAGLTLSVLARMAGKIHIDLAVWWEDMCYRSGPLLSPAHFSRWMVPRYRRITDFLRQEFGCGFNSLDCDGNIHALVPLWLEGGINVMYPLEAAHTNAYEIADAFGTRVALHGYFDKRALSAGPPAIDREFARLEPLIERGGFIPHTDHLVPPDVSWANYCYYRERKLEAIGKRAG